MQSNTPHSASWDSLWDRPENTQFAAGPSFRHKMRILMRLVRKYGKHNGATLDIACGTGELLAMLPSAIKKNGIDISRLAVERAGRALPTARFQVLDIEKQTLSDKFSMIFCTNALEEMTSDGAAIKNMASMLDNDGRLFIVTPHRKAYWTKKDKEAGNKRRYEISEIKTLLSNANLRTIAIRSWGWPLYRVWYRAMAQVNQDTVWKGQKRTAFARMLSIVAYTVLWIDDIFAWTQYGSILFIVATHETTNNTKH